MQNYNYIQIENRFYNLANKIDKILNNYNTDITIIANPLLSLNRLHPDYLQEWFDFIYFEKISTKVKLKLNFCIFLNMVLNLLAVMKELLISNKFKDSEHLSSGAIDLILISHYLGGKLENEDFYYGHILNECEKQNISAIRLLIPHTNTNNNINGLGGNYILNYSLNFNEVLNYLYLNIISLLKIIRYFIHSKLSYYELLVLIIGQFKNFTNYKNMILIQKFILTFNPKNLIMTFEGNSIEKCIFSLCHKYLVKSFGYQHAPIIKGQYSIFNNHKKDIVPDVILTSGKFTQLKFLKYIQYTNSIIDIGTKKYDDISNYLGDNKSNKSILLVPDGNAQSVQKFIEIGLSLLKINPDFKITIRSHPIMNYLMQKNMSKLPISILANFKVSKSNLKVDLDFNFWVIYQNSSVSIESIRPDIFLIYFQNSLADVNPLWENSELYISVDSLNSLYKVLLNKKYRSSQDIKNILKLRSHYYSKLNYREFFKLLS